MAWDAPEQELTFAVWDLGRELRLQGAMLDAWSSGVVQGAPSATILFQNGRQLTIQEGTCSALLRKLPVPD